MARKVSSFLLLGFLFVLSCTSGADKELSQTVSTATFEIEGMVCQMGCAAVINEKIAALEGVSQAEVNFENKTAKVVFNPAYVDAAKIKAAVKNAGKQYEIKNLQVSVSQPVSQQGEANAKKLKAPSAEKSVIFKPLVFPDIFQNLKKIF